MIKLYRVKDGYIDYLRKHDEKVLDNKGEKRPYVGTVCMVNAINYYIPMASPKPKFANMSNAADFHRIEGGRYGALNFNNMIPVKDGDLIEIRIPEEPDTAYRNLLRHQYNALVKMQETIKEKAKTLRTLCGKNEDISNYEQRIKNRCCDFALLEEKMEQYHNNA